MGLNDRGLIAPGYLADIVLLEDVETCRVHTAIRGGETVDDELFAHRKPVSAIGRHSVKLDRVTPQQFAVPACGPTGPVIGLRPDQPVTVREGEVVAELPLPLAGLMSDLSFGEVCHRLSALRRAASAMGCRLREPFLSLSFLPLPVIPHLKITDRGLVNVDRFQLIGLSLWSQWLRGTASRDSSRRSLCRSRR